MEDGGSGGRQGVKAVEPGVGHGREAVRCRGRWQDGRRRSSIALLLATAVLTDAVSARSLLAVLDHAGRRVSGHGHAVAVRPGQLGHVVLFLPLHATVLKPDLDLSLGERQCVRDLDASTSGEVAVEVEFFLQLQSLVASVRLTRPLLLEAEIYSINVHSMSQLTGDIAAEPRRLKASLKPRPY